MRHVGEEFALVLRGQRELRGLVFDQRARAVDLAVFALNLALLFAEQAGALLQLLVGLLQLLLLGLELFLRLLQGLGLGLQLDVTPLQLGLLVLQLRGEGLRLLEQHLGALRRADRVDHDAQSLGELLEERGVDLRVTVEGGELMRVSGLASPRPELIWM